MVISGLSHTQVFNWFKKLKEGREEAITMVNQRQLETIHALAVFTYQKQMLTLKTIGEIEKSHPLSIRVVAKLAHIY